MTVFTDPDAGIVDTENDNCESSLTRTPTGKLATETIVTHKGFTFRRSFKWDANDMYMGATPWVRV